MAWSVLQSAGATNTATTAYPVTFTTANLTSGSKLICAVVSDSSSAQTISSVKDGAGNAMTSLASVGLTDATGVVALYAMDTPAGDAGTKPTITVTVTQASSSCSVLVQEVAGLLPGNTTAMIDGTAGTVAVTGGGSGSTTNPSYTSHAANEYLVAVCGDNGNGITWTDPAGYTGATGGPGSAGTATGTNTSFNNDLELAYKNSANGAETGQFTVNGGSDYAVILVAFNLASATAASGPPLQATFMSTVPAMVTSRAGRAGAARSR